MIRQFIIELGAYSVLIVIITSMCLIALGALIDGYLKERDGVEL